GGQNVHETVDDLAHVDRALVTTPFAGRDQGRDQLPLLVSEIARVTQLAAVVAAAVLGRPHRGDPLCESGPPPLNHNKFIRFNYSPDRHLENWSAPSMPKTRATRKSWS